MKREIWVAVQTYDEDGMVKDSRDGFITIDDEQPYSRPDDVVANLAKSWVKSMLGLPTRPEEGGR